MTDGAAANVPAAGSPPTAPDTAWASDARARLAQADADGAARFDRNDDIDALLRARAVAVDTLVREAWAHCLPADAPLALFAVGGYGRGELYPQSDIDLLVLAEPDAQAAHADALAQFFALLWDAGLPVGHAVRSSAECTAAAAADITVLTALSEARPLRADASAQRALADAIDARHTWPPHDYFVAKREEQRTRHARFGDTADNLEPNLKEGPGGLRDIQTLRWMALRVLGARDPQGMIALGQLGADEYATLERERRALARLRFGLHLVAQRREERLRFDHQKTLAARLGHVDTADNLAVEQMMQGFYRSAAVVLRINDRLLQRFEEQLEGEAVAEPIDAAFELRRGYLAARDADWPALDAASIFDLFATWSAQPRVRGLHSRTARALAEALPAIPAYTAATPALRAKFVALLRGPQAVDTVARMARLGVLARWLPAFAQVSGRMQFDLFHVFTVDQHTLAVLRNIAGFASGTPDERFAIAHEVYPRLRKPELLLLAGLFHDIAKGRGGDHSELGAVDAREFCSAHGLSDADTDIVAWLVRKHLLMSVTAQKQDISDQDVIHRFAREVADRERLDLLYLLTCADIAGTSPKLWNAWKDRLLADLHTATRLALRRGLENPVAAADRIAEARAAAEEALRGFGVEGDEANALFATMPDETFLRGRPDQIAWQAAVLRGARAGTARVSARTLNAQGAARIGALEVFVHSPDRDGLFAAIIATLDRAGLAIQQARLFDGPDGHVFDTFEVLPAEGQRTVAAEDVERRLSTALAAPDLDTIKPARRNQPRHLRHFRIAPQVEFADAADGRTLLSLVCTDRPGLLADVTQVFRAQRLRVHDARIATFGARAEDVFKLTDERDHALDPAHRESLRAALIACFEGDSR
ncbi:bifunctional uridylyltransferase/uridylyl-removing enzyme [Lysobacter helvus]|uniref:Bifunctional uridylyltransferase/uridylyl-removing enzyme n=2 Tax=Lysobacteraceae TaxID=32033 RepID=A0ABN6FZX6_9GAMM|nr:MULTISPECIES: [protein-PII] uridylyltransferase [Lysobacter]BCT93118.1 bifunctional uridylyltransferase/uridylyl-removing enzyme [Lysobacter caseinilyticus]BCT96270.1 bifunctional uridylyltransferase/uridylyl-removing enzyme [Lysobacter helvus]